VAFETHWAVEGSGSIIND